ncbi:MAG: hypothetical protein RR540_00125 [Oscillospiraceae bacterium]
MKAKILTETKDMNANSIAKETEEVFNNWLEFSELTEAEFLENCGRKGFTIIHETSPIKLCKIGFLVNNTFEIMGKPILSNSRNPDERDMWTVNIYLLLLYAANKLDMALKLKLQSSTVYDGKIYDYFYQCVKNQWNIQQ